MIKIHERYINNACRIREEYLRCLELISSEEKIINEHKLEIEFLVENNQKFIDKNENTSLEVVKKELNDSLLNIDEKITKISNKIQPLLVKIEKLKKESTDLFISIKDKYPSLSEEKIQRQIFNNIKR